MSGRLALPGLVLALGVALLAGCGGGGDDGGENDNAGGGDGAAVCASVEAPAARDEGTGEAPADRLAPDRTYSLVFETSCGSFTVTLDQESAPATAASLVSLAGDGFYDETVFHRIVPGFVIQGGDPTQTGAGGPGYSTVDPPPADAAYVKGVVAMAKTGAEPAGTAGSQFFVVTGADVGLPPDYAIVGTVTEGITVVEAIDAQGDSATELPLQPVVVARVTVRESA